MQKSVNWQTCQIQEFKNDQTFSLKQSILSSAFVRSVKTIGLVTLILCWTTLKHEIMVTSILFKSTCGVNKIWYYLFLFLESFWLKKHHLIVNLSKISNVQKLHPQAKLQNNLSYTLCPTFWINAIPEPSIENAISIFQ